MSIECTLLLSCRTSILLGVCLCDLRLWFDRTDLGAGGGLWDPRALPALLNAGGSVLDLLEYVDIQLSPDIVVIVVVEVDSKRVCDLISENRLLF